MEISEVEKYTIYEVVHGSHAYGTNIATSDTDIKGVCLVPDLRYFFGLSTFEQQDGGWGCDKVIYHLPKFMKLAGDCNPNIIEMLFVNDEHILKIDAYGKVLRDNRKLFLSQKAIHTFTGYAISQLKKIKAKKRWICSPVEMPKVGDFKSKDDFNAAKRDYDNYQHWINERNKDRMNLEVTHGYDTKHACHLVRLMRMGLELVETGEVNVKRADAEELLAIRNGAWTYDKLIDYAAEMDAKFNRYRENKSLSVLPYTPDWKQIEKLQIEMISDAILGKIQYNNSSA